MQSLPQALLDEIVEYSVIPEICFLDALGIVSDYKADQLAQTLSEMLPHLFDPFAQAESALDPAHGGLGIGLTLVRSLAEMHGGKLAIQSEVGRGTIVSITLPRTFGGRREPEATAAE